MTWGKQWDRQVDLSAVFHNASITYQERRDAICQRLEDLKVVDDEFCEALEDLRHAPDEDEFDYVLAGLYDWADDGKRLWIKTF